MTAPHNYDHERALWDAFAEHAWKGVAEDEPVFHWTQYKGHGPGPEILGKPESVLEMGHGTGRALAYLAQQGIKGTGVDLSPIAVEQTSKRWGHLGATFVCAEIQDHLVSSTETYDAIYSIFGAAWFTDPESLFPLVAARLSPGGVFAFSQPPAIPGAYGPQGMYKGGFSGPAMFAYRYSYTVDAWADLLGFCGFTDIEVREIDAPKPGHIGTLLGRAVRG